MKKANKQQSGQKGYTSAIDQLFHDFDKNRKALPESRHAEKNKYEIIASKRDKA